MSEVAPSLRQPARRTTCFHSNNGVFLQFLPVVLIVISGINIAAGAKLVCVYLLINLNSLTQVVTNMKNKATETNVEILELKSGQTIKKS